MYSLVIKIAKLVNKAEKLAMGIPIIWLTNDKVLDVIVDPDPIKFSVIIISTFFFFTLLHFFL